MPVCGVFFDVVPTETLLAVNHSESMESALALIVTGLTEQSETSQILHFQNQKRSLVSLVPKLYANKRLNMCRYRFI
jgi:hypothetical protein